MDPKAENNWTEEREFTMQWQINPLKARLNRR